MIGKKLTMIIYKNCINISLIINWYKIGKRLVTEKKFNNKKIEFANHLCINDW